MNDKLDISNNNEKLESNVENPPKVKKSFKEVMTNCGKKIKDFFVNLPHNTKDFFVNFPDNSKRFLKDLPNKKGFNSVVSSLVSILIGIFVGFIIMVFMVILNNAANPMKGLGLLFSGPFSGTGISRKFGDMIFKTVPLIFTGLSVAIAYKTGLFNIGAPGQFLMGTMGALLVALNINTTGNRFAGVMVWILAILVAVVLSVIWALIPGFLKAKFGINEVIICIMTNWIAGNIITWVFTGSKHLQDTRVGKDPSHLIPSGLTGNYTPNWGMGSKNGSVIDISIFIAIIIAILLWIMMNKTTLGYTLKACGYNKNAAKYAGINETLNIMIAMGIAGALAGLGGAFMYLNKEGDFNYSQYYMTMPGVGFNGIPAALLANSNPIGVIFSSLFMQYLSSSSLSKAGYNNYIAEIIIAVIIYLAGFSRFFSENIEKIKKYFKKKSGVIENDINSDKDKKETKVNFDNLLEESTAKKEDASAVKGGK